MSATAYAALHALAAWRRVDRIGTDTERRDALLRLRDLADRLAPPTTDDETDEESL